MENFKKITKEIFYDEKFDLKDYLDSHTYNNYFGNICDVDILLQESLIGCESPIEQMLALELEHINLLNMHNFNPFIDVIAIEKQEEIKCKGNKYRVDFIIPVSYKNQDNKFFIIECDGHEFHQKTKEQVEKDNKRQRDLQAEGYEVIRFSGTEIYHKSYQCACYIRNIIISKCKYINDEVK